MLSCFSLPLPSFWITNSENWISFSEFCIQQYMFALGSSKQDQLLLRFGNRSSSNKINYSYVRDHTSTPSTAVALMASVVVARVTGRSRRDAAAAYAGLRCRLLMLRSVARSMSNAPSWLVAVCHPRRGTPSWLVAGCRPRRGCCRDGALEGQWDLGRSRIGGAALGLGGGGYMEIYMADLGCCGRFSAKRC